LVQALHLGPWFAWRAQGDDRDLGQRPDSLERIPTLGSSGQDVEDDQIGLAHAELIQRLSSIRRDEEPKAVV
jgi:hypothetical protein